MGLFSKPKKASGSLAVAFDKDGVRVARIKGVPDALPQVRLAAFHPGADGPTLDALVKIGKDLHASAFNCHALLAGGQYQLVSVEAPTVPAEELRTAVRWRLKDIIDFPVDQATVDVLQVPVDKAAAGRAASLFAIAARNSVIAARQDALIGAGFRLSVIDIPEMAQRNFSAMLEPEGRGLAMLSFSAEGGLLTVTFNGELYLARRIDVTVEQLHDLDHERKHGQFDRITLELQRSLDHFERQFSFISVSKLVLAPSGVQGLEEYLSSNLYTKVETLDLASVIDLSAVPDLATPIQQQPFFLVLGAALREAGAQ